MYKVFELRTKEEILKRVQNDKICCLKVNLNIEKDENQH